MLKPIEVKEVQISDFKRQPERYWVKCDSCKQEVFRDTNGKTSYHARGCKEDKVKYYVHPPYAQRG